MTKKDELVEFSSLLSSYVVGAEGNVSSRLQDGTFLIKGSGKSMSNITRDDFVLCNKDGTSVTKSEKPSIESPIHAWIYQNYDVKYVAHTHPTNVLKILCSKKVMHFSKCRLFPEQIVFNGMQSVVVDYAKPGSELLEVFSKEVGKFKTFPRLVLLKNHGIIVASNSIRDCITRTQICEKSAQIYEGSLKLGMNELSLLEIEKIEKDEKEIYRRVMF